LKIRTNTLLEIQISPVLDDLRPIEPRPRLEDQHRTLRAGHLLGDERANYARSDHNKVGIRVAIIEAPDAHEGFTPRVDCVPGCACSAIGGDTPAGGGAETHHAGPPKA
jgi:hypothetical protein